jgi:iron(III) transport system substrate-binding protein
MFEMLGRRRLSSALAILVVAVIIGACGGATPSASEAANPAAEVFDRFNAMTGEARKAALIEAAKAEGGLVMYTTAPGYQPAIDAFSEKYDIEVELFIGRSDTILQRVTQEYAAGVHQVDVFEDENARLLQADGLTYEYINDELTSQGLGYVDGDHMVPFRLSVPTTAWNTSLVADSEVPESIEELADPKWDGRLVLDSGAWNWYATIKQYLANKGWDEARIKEFFQTVIAYSSQQPTSIAMSGLLAAGEYAMGTSILTFVSDRDAAAGAPVAWRTASGAYTKPIVVAPEGGALMSRAPHPATAMLLIDFMLEEGAPLLQENHWPSPIQSEGGTLEGVAEEDIMVVDRAVAVEDRQKWIDEWDALLRGE